jgi:hypothetical protein
MQCFGSVYPYIPALIWTLLDPDLFCECGSGFSINKTDEHRQINMISNFYHFRRISLYMCLEPKTWLKQRKFKTKI